MDDILDYRRQICAVPPEQHPREGGKTYEGGSRTSDKSVESERRTLRRTLEPVRGVDAIILDPLFIRIGQRTQNHEYEHVEAHVSRILQNLNDHTGKVVVRHDLVHRISEEDTRVRMRKLCYRSGEAVDGIVR